MLNVNQLIKFFIISLQNENKQHFFAYFPEISLIAPISLSKEDDDFDEDEDDDDDEEDQDYYEDNEYEGDEFDLAMMMTMKTLMRRVRL
jgi:hypothetical protein